MGGPLRVGGTVARILAQMYKKPLIGVNHCVARTRFWLGLEFAHVAYLDAF